ncbi:histidine kinase N-terminal domain-containing protein [Anaerolineales bacterium HSG6]|nr:histidine kinase N-terminal domain-containing protein [Anaerolineales bacterium HSG6]MDM8531406.1 histidine kinase N-terminal domain-containing protein [Anaerolineales bacterium HSG25]
MHDAVNYCLNLNQDSIEFLSRIEAQMGIVSDLSRADILLYGRKSGDEVVVLAHARPTSIARVYNKSREGRIIEEKIRPEVFKALIEGTRQADIRSFIFEGAPVVRTIYPVYYPPPLGQNWGTSKAQIVGALTIVTNLIEYERQRLRNQVFREVVSNLQVMLLRARVPGTNKLTPFGEQDGVLFADINGVIRYASGVAANLYRRIGYKETLVGRHLLELDTTDEEMRQLSLEHQNSFEKESEENGRIWIRKVIPVFSYPSQNWRWLKILKSQSAAEKMSGVLLTFHDETDVRRQSQELRIKNAMIQEVHHRVKNNLQTIAGLVRMQTRRVKSSEAKVVLEETLSRILSVAIIHEFLSNEDGNIIDIKEISGRILSQFRQGMISPDQKIQLELTGEAIYLPARQATACSLVINELLQNALEHGVGKKRSGTIRVNLHDGGDDVIISVSDDGDGLPHDFSFDNTTSLGLQIVKILVEGDLRGKIKVVKNDDSTGASIQVVFQKTLFEGEEGWKEHAS